MTILNFFSNIQSILKYLFSFLLVIIFIYFRPLYSIIFLIVFSSEYIFMLRFFYNIRVSLKDDSYRCFKITDLNGDENVYDLWEKVCELIAYKKIYILCLKKKINIWSVFISSFIIIVGIPLKIILLFYFILKSRKSLRFCLIDYYYKELGVFLNHKIEIECGKIYINCSVRSDILCKLINLNRNKSVNDISILYKKLVTADTDFRNTREFMKIDNHIPFLLGKLTTEDSYKIKKPHWSSIDKSVLEGESVKTIVHATSTLPKLLSPTQLTGLLIPRLWLPGSPNPGTVVTRGDFEFTQVSKTIRMVPKWQVEYVYYDIYGTDRKSMFNDFFQEQDRKFADILEVGTDNFLIKEIASGRYSTVLEKDSFFNDSELLTEIENIMKEF